MPKSVEGSVIIPAFSFLSCSNSSRSFPIAARASASSAAGPPNRTVSYACANRRAAASAAGRERCRSRHGASSAWCPPRGAVGAKIPRRSGSREARCRRHAATPPRIVATDRPASGRTGCIASPRRYHVTTAPARRRRTDARSAPPPMPTAITPQSGPSPDLRWRNIRQSLRQRLHFVLKPLIYPPPGFDGRLCAARASGLPIAGRRIDRHPADVRPATPRTRRGRRAVERRCFVLPASCA